MPEPAPAVILAEGLGKCYRVVRHPRHRLGELLGLSAHAAEPDRWALRDVSFSVAAGESVGIIGRNGSGKSTLLQMIVGTLEPTAGHIHASGRIAALLELGSGFNPDFSGRENVYIGCALQGLSRRETDERFDAIAAFADIGDYLDEPVRTYSSGMMLRLAFAVQAMVEPDILVVDEAIGVGDVFFQQKCARRMQELRARGTTLLFVSHDMAQVRDLCARAIYLREGKAVFVGDVRQAINLYFREDMPEPAHVPRPANLSSAVPERFRPDAFWMRDGTEEDGGKAALLCGVALLGTNGEPTTSVRMADEIIFRVLLLHLSRDPVHVAVAINNRHDIAVTVFGTSLLGMDPLSGEAGDYSICEFRVTARIEAGQYTFQAVVGRPVDGLPNGGRPEDVSPWLGPLTVAWDYQRDKAPFLGLCGVPVEALVRPASEVFP